MSSWGDRARIKELETEVKDLRKALSDLYNDALEIEEKRGWPGDEPHWSLRQRIIKLLDKD